MNSWFKRVWNWIVGPKVVNHYDVGKATVTLFLDDGKTATFVCTGRVTNILSENYVTKAESEADYRLAVYKWIADDKGIRHRRETIRSYSVATEPYVVEE